jgi:uncharacterized membrane protein YhaH (DUF805 family)
MTLLQTLFGFQGRIDRGTLWLCAVALVLIDAAALVVAQGWTAAGRGDAVLIGSALILIVAITTWSGVALKVKRLHDRGRSGLYLLAALVPVAGWIWLAWEVGFAPARRSGARFDPGRTAFGGPAR